MDILQKIELLSSAVEALSNEVSGLKLMVSENASSQPGPGAPSDMENQLMVIASYLALSPGMEQDELLNTLLVCAMTVVKAEGTSITLYDETKNVLVFRAAVGIASDRIIGVEVPLANSQQGIAFRTRQVVASTPMYKEVTGITGEHYSSVLAAPLLIDNEPIGTLGAVNKRNEDNFSVQDIVDFQSFADLAAHVIRQRLRENSLKKLIQGSSAEIPKELSGVKISSDNQDFLEITQNIAAIGRRSPQLLSLCKQLVGVISNIA
jgi:transcriptional regulator with GAF, ATPase, and Fis domain